MKDMRQYRDKRQNDNGFAKALETNNLKRRKSKIADLKEDAGKKSVEKGWSNFLLKQFPGKEKICRRLRRLYVASDDEIERICNKYYLGIIRNIAICLLICGVFSFILWIKGKGEVGGGIVLERESYGGESYQVKLVTDIENIKEDFQVEIMPVSYRDDELPEIFDKGFEYLESVYLGDNVSADNITSNLNLVESIDNLGLTVSWIADNPDLVNAKGEVIRGTLKKNELTNVTAVISYEDKEASKIYPLSVAGVPFSESEIAINHIKEAISVMQKEHAGEQTLVIPAQIAGHDVARAGKIQSYHVILVLGIILAMMLGVRGYTGLRDEEAKRSDMLVAEYPEFVDMLSLYMGAGLTVKGALLKILEAGETRKYGELTTGGTEKCNEVTAAVAGRFKKQVNASTKKPGKAVVGVDFKNILYKEIKYCLNEIQSGIPEPEAYYRMGHRLNISYYLKLMSLLSQNIKKGTADILEHLKAEEHEALRIRKEIARKKGEEAGTKLLFPMILLLGVVMVIIVAPAFMSF